MVRDVGVILNKELRNLSKDRRSILAAFILPAISLPIIILAIGIVLSGVSKDNSGYPFSVRFTGDKFPEFIQRTKEVLNVPDNPKGPPDIRIRIERRGGGYAISASYDSRSNRNRYAIDKIRDIVASLNTQHADHLLARNGLSRSQLEPFVFHANDTAPADVSGSTTILSLIPYFIVVFIFSGGMNLGLDASAGEKERGTLALYLANRVSRRSIAVAKTLYIMVASTISAASNFVGIVAVSLLGGGLGIGLTLNIRVLSSVVTIVEFAILLFSLSSLTSSIILWIGAMSKSVKEGSSYLLPVYILLVALGAATMQLDVSNTSYVYVIPIVNVLIAMRNLLMQQLVLVQFVLVVVTNAVVVALLSLAVIRVFNSERILETV